MFEEFIQIINKLSLEDFFKRIKGPNYASDIKKYGAEVTGLIYLNKLKAITAPLSANALLALIKSKNFVVLSNMARFSEIFYLLVEKVGEDNFKNEILRCKPFLSTILSLPYNTSEFIQSNLVELLEEKAFLSQTIFEVLNEPEVYSDECLLTLKHIYHNTGLETFDNILRENDYILINSCSITNAMNTLHWLQGIYMPIQDEFKEILLRIARHFLECDNLEILQWFFSIITFKELSEKVGYYDYLIGLWVALINTAKINILNYYFDNLSNDITTQIMPYLIGFCYAEEDDQNREELIQWLKRFSAMQLLNGIKAMPSNEALAHNKFVDIDDYPNELFMCGSSATPENIYIELISKGIIQEFLDFDEWKFFQYFPPLKRLNKLKENFATLQSNANKDFLKLSNEELKRVINEILPGNFSMVIKKNLNSISLPKSIKLNRKQENKLTSYGINADKMTLTIANPLLFCTQFITDESIENFCNTIVNTEEFEESPQSIIGEINTNLKILPELRNWAVNAHNIQIDISGSMRMQLIDHLNSINIKPILPDKNNLVIILKITTRDINRLISTLESIKTKDNQHESSTSKSVKSNEENTDKETNLSKLLPLNQEPLDVKGKRKKIEPKSFTPIDPNNPKEQLNFYISSLREAVTDMESGNVNTMKQAIEKIQSTPLNINICNILSQGPHLSLFGDIQHTFIQGFKRLLYIKNSFENEVATQDITVLAAQLCISRLAYAASLILDKTDSTEQNNLRNFCLNCNWLQYEDFTNIFATIEAITSNENLVIVERYNSHASTACLADIELSSSLLTHQNYTLNASDSSLIQITEKFLTIYYANFDEEIKQLALFMLVIYIAKIMETQYIKPRLPFFSKLAPYPIELSSNDKKSHCNARYFAAAAFLLSYGFTDAKSVNPSFYGEFAEEYNLKHSIIKINTDDIIETVLPYVEALHDLLSQELDQLADDMIEEGQNLSKLYL